MPSCGGGLGNPGPYIARWVTQAYRPSGVNAASTGPPLTRLGYFGNPKSARRTESLMVLIFRNRRSYTVVVWRNTSFWTKNRPCWLDSTDLGVLAPMITRFSRRRSLSEWRSSGEVGTVSEATSVGIGVADGMAGRHWVPGNCEG